MTLLAGPDHPAPRDVNAEVLFAEARRRRRRRRLVAATAVIVMAALIGWLIDGAGRGTTSGQPRAAVPGPPHAAPKQVQRGAAPALLIGKYELPTLAVAPGGGAALLWLHGYVGAANTQIAWLDRTIDSGSSWTAGEAANVDRTTSPVSDFNFSYIGKSEVIGYGGNGLSITRDGGRRWQHRLGGWTVLDVAAIRRGVWVVAQHCLGDNAVCPSVVLRRGSSVSRFTAISPQPPRAADVDLVPGASRPMIVYSPSRNGRWRVAVSGPGSSSWVTHALPCQPAADAGLDLLASGSTVWFPCRTRYGGSGQADGFYSTYRSIDDGANWTKTSAGGGLFDLSIASVISPRVAWAQDGGDAAPAVTIRRTLDGGRRWQPAVSPPGSSSGYAATNLVGVSATTAWCVVQHYPSDGTTYFTVDRTTNGGRSWQATVVPVAPNLPSRAIAR